MYDVLNEVDVCESGFGSFRKSRPLDGVLFEDFDSLKSIKIVSCQKKMPKKFCGVQNSPYLCIAIERDTSSTAKRD